jgi:hypothetical protein
MPLPATARTSVAQMHWHLKDIDPPDEFSGHVLIAGTKTAL